MNPFLLGFELNKEIFIARFKSKISARWHMSFISVGTIASGILLSKALLYFNFPQPMLRYGIAIVFSYLAFFLLIHLWLRFHFQNPREAKSTFDFDPSAALDIPGFVGQSPNSNIQDNTWGGGGGEFSGAGASSSWGSESKWVSPKKEGSSSIFEAVGDVDEGIVIFILIGLILAVSGSAVYLIAQAPEILFEAAFEMFLVSTLVNQSKKTQTEGWVATVFKKTWLSFFSIFLFALLFGYVIQKQCPNAKSFGEYREQCLKK